MAILTVLFSIVHSDPAAKQSALPLASYPGSFSRREEPGNIGGRSRLLPYVIIYVIYSDEIIENYHVIFAKVCMCFPNGFRVRKAAQSFRRRHVNRIYKTIHEIAA